MNVFPKPRQQKRVRHNILIASTCAALTAASYAVLSKFYADAAQRVFCASIVSGYIAALLLAATLTLGAWNIMRRIINPVSSDLRRDIGIWCALFTSAHVLFGLNVHMKIWTQYFIDDAGAGRTDLFGFANYLGAAATLIVLALAITSNDFSIRHLGREQWKSIQRWNYVLIFLTVAHGIVYQAVEQRLMPYLIILSAVALWIAAMQIAGLRAKRHEPLRASTIQSKSGNAKETL